jgi:hypothetical protein
MGDFRIRRRRDEARIDRHVESSRRRGARVGVSACVAAETHEDLGEAIED